MNQKQIYKNASRLFFLCFLAYTCSYIGRKNFSACLPEMINHGFLDKTQGGTITTAYMLVYGLGQMLSGIIGTKVKPRFMIGIGLCGAGICNLSMGFLPSAALMPFVWACNGLFHSMLWAPIIRIFTDLLPVDRRSAAGTNIAVSCSVGAILAFLIPGIVLRFAEWQVVFYVSGGALLLCFFIWVIGNRFLSTYIRMMEAACLAERQAIQEQRQNTSMTPPKHSPRLFVIMITSGLWVVLLGLICNGALRDAVETWAPTFLSEQFKLDGSLAALISVIIPIISISGTYIANLLHEKLIKNEFLTSAIMFAIATLCVGGLCLCHQFSATLCTVFMAISVSAMWGANHMFLTVVPYHFASLGLSAAITGTLNSIIYFSSAICSGLYGFLAETLGWTLLIILWLGVGVVGTTVCLAGTHFWAKKRAELDQGSL